MNENLNQPEQDLTQVGNPFPSRGGPLSQQDPALSGDSPYEETHLPYLPLPNESPQPTSSPLGADSPAVDTSSFSSPGDTSRYLAWQQGAVVLIAVILGAILGGVAAHASEGSLVWGVVVGGSIGAVVGVVIALIPLETLLGWLVNTLLGGLVGELLNCCLSSVFLVVASIITVAGFLLWHSLLLAALVGGSIVIMMLVGLSVVAASYKAGLHASCQRRASKS